MDCDVVERIVLAATRVLFGKLGSVEQFDSIHPGAGRDVVDAGAGDDTIIVMDVCEVVPGCLNQTFECELPGWPAGFTCAGDVCVQWLGRVRCLEEITVSRVIDGSPSVENLDALGHLRSVGGGISITFNAALTDVSELNDVEMSEVLEITNNATLPQCDAETLGQVLAQIGNVTSRDIPNNLGQCS